MYISSCAHNKERCFKVAKCIYHDVLITRKDVLKLRNVYIIKCSSQGKMFQGCEMYISSSGHHKERRFKAGQCIYHHLLITRKDVLKLCNVYISCVDHKERCLKVVQCTYHQVLITRKVVLKLCNVYIIMCSSQGMSFSMYISSSVHRKETFLNLRNV